MKLNFFQKVLLIVALLGLTYLYASYERKVFYGSSADNSAPVLKVLPDFNVTVVESNQVIKSNDFLAGSAGAFVHIWGTWCAPCEKEMPEFLSYAAKVQDTGVKFLLVAVN